MKFGQLQPSENSDPSIHERSVDSLEQKKVEVKNIYNTIAMKNRGDLFDQMHLVAHGCLGYDETDEPVMYEKVSGELGQYFDAHGVNKINQLDALIALLDGGIDSTRSFYTAPFSVTDEMRKGASVSGTSGGEAYKDGLAVVVSGYGESLSRDGIRIVFINDVFGDMVPALAELYPQYKIAKLSEQKAVLGDLGHVTP